MDWVRRLDVIILTFMLVYALAVVTRVFYRRQVVQDPRKIDSLGRNKLRADLSVQAHRLKSIASAAPYLGLLGTCFGILNAPGIGSGFDLEKSAAPRLISSGIAAALITTAAGILVTIPAICSYNYVCTRLSLLESEQSDEIQKSRFQADKFPLKKRFSQLPAFALIAATCLSIFVAVYTPYFDPLRATGLAIDLASTRCEYDGDDRLIVLHVTNASKIFLNTEEEDWKNLAGRLSEIYGMREHRTLYLLADEEVSFQTIADVIDIVESTETTAKTERLDIKVRLITPAAEKAHCLHPVVPRPSLHGST
jgi:biopolymer transport protein ExbD